MKERDEMVYSTEAPNFLPREGLMEFVETSTTTKRWIYKKVHTPYQHRKQRRGKVVYIKKGGNEV